MATDKNFVIKNGLTVGTTEIVDSSGNLTNIGTISSGAITAPSINNTATITFNSTGNNPTVTLNRYSGQPSLKAGTDDSGYLIMDSSGGNAALNWYTSNNVVLAFGGGNVGIADNTPSQRLDVNGNIGIGGTEIITSSRNLTNIGTISSGVINSSNINIDAAGTSERYLQIGTGTTANHYAYIDLIGDTTYTDYALRLIRGNSGANSGSQLIHRGTGNLDIQATDSASIRLRTASLDALTIDSSQNATFAGTVSVSNIISTGDTTIKPAAGSDALFFNAHNSESQLRLYNNRQDLSNVPVSSIVGYNGVQVSKIQFYRGGGGSSGYINFQVKPQNGESLTDTFQIGDNNTVDYGVNVRAGGYRVGGQTVIDSSRNLTNIGTISSGAITSTGDINLTSTTSTSPAITFNTSSGTDTTIDMAIRATGEGLDFYEPEDGDKVHMRIVDDSGVNAVFGLRTGSGDGTLRLDASGNLTNIGTISSGAITSTSSITGRTGTFTGQNGTALEVNSGTTNVTATFESSDAQAWINLKDSNSSTYGTLLGGEGGLFRLRTNNNDDTTDLTVDTAGNLGVSGDVVIGTDDVAVNSDANITVKEGNAFCGIDLKSLRTSGNIGGVRSYNSSNTLVNNLLFEVQGRVNLNNNLGIAINSTTFIDGARNITAGTISTSGNINAGANINVQNNGILDVTTLRVRGDNDTGYSTPAGLTGGISLWSTGATTSQIMFKPTSAGSLGNHGFCTNTYNTYFVMDTTNRGWVFRNHTTATNVASISNTGGASFNNGIKINATTIVDSSRNLTNIGTISSGAITSGAIDATSSAEEVIRVNTTGNSAAIHWRDSDVIRGLMGFSNGSSIYVGADDHDMVIRSETKIHLVSNTNNLGITLNGGNATFGGTISSGAITTLGTVTVDTDGADAMIDLKGDGAYDSVLRLRSDQGDITTEGFEIWYDNSVGDVHLNTTYPDDAASIHFQTRTGAGKSTANKRLTINGNGNVDIVTGSLRMGTTAVIDASRNLTNIGAITSSGNVIVGENGAAAYLTNANGVLYFGDNDLADHLAYSIGTKRKENIGGDYTKLNIDWHTGITLGASPTYGGVRFFNNSVGHYNSTTKLFSVGEGSSDVKVYNDLNVVSNIEINGTTVISSGRAVTAVSYGAPSGTTALYYGYNGSEMVTGVNGAAYYHGSDGGGYGIVIQGGHPICKSVKIGSVNAGTTVIDASRNGVFERLRADGGNLIMGNEAYSASNSYVGMKTSFQSGSNDYMILSGLSDGETYVSAKDGSAVTIRGGGNNSSNQITVPDGTTITATTSDFRVTGNVTAYASDKRLKTNIKIIENPIEKIKKIRGVEFDWLDDIENFNPKHKHETGVIAQEIEAVIPDAVSPAPFNEEYKTVDKDKIVALLIEAIKEQQKEIEKLKEEVSSLSSKI
jgi:hypothetical protein